MSKSQPDKTRRRWPPFVIFGAALAIRIAYVLSIRHTFFFDHLITEPQHYDEWARAILDGRAPVHLPFDEAPGYPYVVALIYKLTGRSLVAVLIAQALAGAAACVAIARVAERIAGERAGWIAGGIAACFAPFIYFTGQLEPAAFPVALVAAALALTPTDEATPRRWYLAAALWCAAILMRSELVLALPVLVIHAWKCAGRRRAGRVAMVPAAFLALTFVVNLAGSGHPVLLTVGSGVNLRIGNNPDADGVSPFLPTPLSEEANAIQETAHDAVEADAAFRAHAVAYMRSEPGAAVALAAKKLAWTFTHRELPNAADIQWQTAQSWMFHPPFFPIGFGLLCPLAFAGAALLGRRWRQHLILAAPVVVVLISCTLMFTNARFRLLMMPSLIVLAGVAIEQAISLVREPSRKGITLGAAGLVIGSVLAWANLGNVAHYRIAEIDALTGVLERGAGHYAKAERYLRASLQRAPHDMTTWMQLHDTLEEAGRPADAAAVMQQARAQNPDDPMLRLSQPR